MHNREIYWNWKIFKTKKIRESIKDLEEDDNPCLILYELK